MKSTIARYLIEHRYAPGVVNDGDAQVGHDIQILRTGMFVKLEAPQPQVVALMHEHGAEAARFVFGVMLGIADEMTGIPAANVRNFLVRLFERVIRNRKGHALVDACLPAPPQDL